MPIKGLSDRGLAFPEIGQIRKGAKKGENRPGADLNYFRVEFDENEKKAPAVFNEIYGAKPTAIRILFPFNEIEKIWDPWLEAYTAGRLVARSDGEFVTYMLDNKGEVLVMHGLDRNGNKVPHPINGIAGYDHKGEPVKFKPTGRLKVIVPELKRVAFLTVMTTSTHDIGNISDQLRGFQELNNGQLAGIPFILRRKPKAISMPKSSTDKTRVRRVKWLLSIEVDPDWAIAKFGQLNAMALPQGYEAPALPAGEPVEDATDYDEDEVIDEQEEEAFPVPEATEEAEVIEIVDSLGQWAVSTAAKFWNISNGDAAKAIGKAQLGKIDKRIFLAWLNDPQRAAESQPQLV